MSCSSDSSGVRVSPAMNVKKFYTAHRKLAAANIFENVNQDVLVKLFEKSGDVNAADRARRIFSLCQDPERMTKELKALHESKDRSVIAAVLRRQLWKCRDAASSRAEVN